MALDSPVAPGKGAAVAEPLTWGQGRSWGAAGAAARICARPLNDNVGKVALGAGRARTAAWLVTRVLAGHRGSGRAEGGSVCLCRLMPGAQSSG